MIEIVDPGPLTSVQDLGRPGYATLGVARSGAFDRAALRLANRLVGNPDGSAALEVTYGGLSLVIHDAATVALTGAVCEGLDWGAASTLRSGTPVRLAPPATGLRSYLAVRGGIAAPAVLGSRGTDTLSGLGPALLRAGDRLDVGTSSMDLDGASAPPRPAVEAVDVTPGPRLDWFTPDAWSLLLSARWRVRAECDRIGIRLDGPPLPRVRDAELPSEPTRPGAVQVPGDGRPIVFGPDAPVTGGYPVIAVLADLSQVAQLRPGDGFRFRVRPGSGAARTT